MTERWEVGADMAGRAFSFKEGHKARRMRITCPVCGYRLLDTTLQDGIEVRATEEVETGKVDYYLKCRQCKAELALVKTKNEIE